jgi:hypothetical protein
VTATSEAIVNNLEALHLYQFIKRTVCTLCKHVDATVIHATSHFQDSLQIPIDFVAKLLSRAIAQVNKALINIINTKFLKQLVGNASE